MKQIAILLALIVMPFQIFANDDSIEFGVKVMFGGRYDNLRMCVASDAGIKGGIIADIMLLTRFPLNDDTKLSLEIPVMRPILFATAFKMLQFEPQVTLEFKNDLDNGIALIAGPGLGLSFHYGPDYLSDNEDNRGDSFFAMGPMLSGTIGFAHSNEARREKRVGLRCFYIPLFSPNDENNNGTVIGGVLEGYFDF